MTLTTQSMTGPLDGEVIRNLEEQFTNVKVTLAAAKKRNSLTDGDRTKVNKSLSSIAGSSSVLAGEIELDIKKLQRKVEQFKAVQKGARGLASEATVARSPDPVLEEAQKLYAQISALLGSS
ncbi:MAG: hypothetical protein Q8R47_03475 [Nanoarchaeota archaeon]|nr:hypothetical protein [Nanoarchaeota archaeon]